MSTPKQYLFTLNRNKTVSGTSGHTIAFVKGEPIHVPREMHEAVLSIGAEPSEELELEPVRKGAAPTEQADRDPLITAAMEDIVLSNIRDDFGANGAPTQTAIEKRTTFSVTKRERDALWTKLKLGEAE